MTTLAAPADSSLEAPSVSRSAALDRLRGLAVLLMLADHVLVFTPHAMPVRLTLTRLAMPLFFLIAGNLATRCRWPRLAWVLGWGLLLPAVAWWIDIPNVLVWYALGVPVIVWCRPYRFGRIVLGLLAVVPLVTLANGEALRPITTGFDPSALLGIMALGALTPRDWFEPGEWLPRWLGWCGRYPLTVYVVHVLLFSVVAVAVGAHVR